MGLRHIQFGLLRAVAIFSNCVLPRQTLGRLLQNETNRCMCGNNLRGLVADCILKISNNRYLFYLVCKWSQKPYRFLKMSAFDGRITPIQVFKLKPVRLIVIETIQSEKKYIFIHVLFQCILIQRSCSILGTLHILDSIWSKKQQKKALVFAPSNSQLRAVPLHNKMNFRPPLRLLM